jgi:hypothetical protein
VFKVKDSEKIFGPKKGEVKEQFGISLLGELRCLSRLHAIEGQ